MNLRNRLSFLFATVVAAVSGSGVGDEAVDDEGGDGFVDKDVDDSTSGSGDLGDNTKDAGGGSTGGGDDGRDGTDGDSGGDNGASSFVLDADSDEDDVTSDSTSFVISEDAPLSFAIDESSTTSPATSEVSVDEAFKGLSYCRVGCSHAPLQLHVALDGFFITLL
uniref:Uncharacterized protein n=1 Tax=Ditylum brightwellii TaxID=49249 RepID=A0A7S4R5J5_9STRA